jgi:hypothetical protein
VTMLPSSAVAGLQAHLAQRRALFEDDQRAGKSEVFLPDALVRKYSNATTEWAWQYIFSSGSYSVDPRSGVERRHHIDEKLLQRAMKKALQAGGLVNRPRRMRCGIRFRRIYWKRVTIFALYRNCWGIRMLRRQ